MTAVPEREKRAQTISVTLLLANYIQGVPEQHFHFQHETLALMSHEPLPENYTHPARMT